MPPAQRPGSGSFCHENEGFRSPRKRRGSTTSLRICRPVPGLKNSVLRTRELRGYAARGPPAARAQGAGSLARGNFLAAHMPPKSPGTGRHNRSEAREGLVWKENDMRARPMGGRHKAGRYSSLSVSTHPRTLFFTRKRANSSCAEVVRW